MNHKARKINKSILALLVVPLLPYSAFASCKAYDPSVRNYSLLDHNFEEQQKIQTQYARSNMANFCERNLKLRYLKANKAINQSQCEQLDNSELENLVVVNSVNDKSIWSRAITPAESAKKQAVQFTEQYVSDMTTLDFYPPNLVPDVKKYFESINRRLAKYSSTTGAAIEAAPATKIKLFCKVENLLNGEKCFKLLTWIKNEFAPRGIGIDIIDLQLWQRIVGTTRYDLGLKHAHNIISKRKTSTESGNIFDDLAAGFTLSGMSQTEAQDAAWDILGFISNQGPSIGTHMSMIDNYEQKESANGLYFGTRKSNLISQIASYMNLYDYRNNHQGKPLYSYPKNILTSCDNYKPYHFWMAAYIARRAVKELKVSPQDAAAATFLTEKGYQIYRNIAGNGMKVKKVAFIFNYGPFDPVHQVIRMDLAYAAVGSRFGADSASGVAQNKSYSVDQAIVKLLENAGKMGLDDEIEKTVPSEGLGGLFSNIFGGYPDMVKNYFKWKSIFAADTAFQDFKD